MKHKESKPGRCGECQQDKVRIPRRIRTVAILQSHGRALHYHQDVPLDVDRPFYQRRKV